MGLKKSMETWHLHALSRLLAEFRPYKIQLGIVFILGLVISAVQPVSVKLSQQIIDGLQQGGTPDFFRWVPAALVLVFTFSGFAKYFHNTVRRKVSEKVIIKFRAALFRKYLMLPLRVIDRTRTGEMLSSIQNDLAQINSGIDTFCILLKEPFTFWA